MKKYIRFIRTKLLDWSDMILTKKLLRNTPDVDIDNSDILFIFSHDRSPYYEKLYTLIAYKLSKLAIPSCFLFKSDLSSHLTNLVIDEQVISNSLFVKIHRVSITNGTDKSMQLEWSTNVETERIEANGVNFFSLIRSNLRSINKRYNIDFTDKHNVAICHELVKTCDLLFRYFLLLKKYANSKGVKIRIVGRESNYIPNGVFRLLCDRLSKNRDVEYIDLARGYMHYFGHHPQESYVAVVNCTRTGIDNRVVIYDKEFGELSKKNDDQNEMLASVNKVLKNTRGATVSQRKKEIIELINKYRSGGKNVFALFAHLFYDTPVCDESPSFKDMCEWITETIEFFRTRDDLLILKPHPAEIRPNEPQKEPNETLASFLGDTIDDRENIVLLEPRLFSIEELHSYLSCGLIWRSSVAMELTYLRVPCIIAGTPLYKVLDLIYTKDKNHYFYLIENVKELTVSDEQILDVARYIYYLKEYKHVHIDSLPYDPYTGKHYWDGKSLQHYLENGDEKLSALVEKMLI